jgi:predicted dienelactone hydrolase
MRPMKTVPAAFLLSLLAIFGLAAESAYSPLTLPAAGKADVRDYTVNDAQRQRNIPIRIYLPAARKAAPVVVFSHGLGGSRTGSAFLGRHWAARGYVAVFLQHPGSDSAVWKGQPVAQRMLALRRAANAKNFLLRVKDVPAVLDQLERWHKGTNHALAGRLDLTLVGMSGHSFGAMTTQSVSGQRTVGQAFTDSRIDAAIVMSPSGPRHRADRTFAKVSIPWLLMTGTKDSSPIGKADIASRLTVFPALPPGSKYELVLDKAEHSVFNERALPGDKEPRNPNHHRAILALSTAFWDAHLRQDTRAREWLDGDGAKSVLEKADRWQTK